MALRKKNELQFIAKKRLLSHLNPKSPIAEQYRTIRTNIQFSNVEKEMKSIVVTSSSPGEGKSTTVTNLAIVFAQQEKRVLLVDADLRKPTIYSAFRMSNHIGLTNVLTQQSTLQAAIKTTEVPNLSVLVSGPVPPNPAELLGSSRMKEVLEELYQMYDVILIDTPPVLAVADAQILANLCHGIVMVISSGKTKIEHARKTRDLLSQAKGKLLGAILNNKRKSDADLYYYYSSN
ncbi:CpsD/CapB family tyrosine-protein kinase [Bacillus smithii]|uniref:CpsD/CapB family tyrosine-protein kinase n=1 Tax=Bacillus smithii TaxID=1479 RepID=UPI003D1A07DA